MNDKYISVLMIQAKIDVKITTESELAEFNDNWWKQWNHAQELIKELRPDITMFPETFYNPMQEEVFKSLTHYSPIIIAGSTYKDKKNYTVICTSNIVDYVIKNNPSPLEAAGRFMDYQSFDNLITNGLWWKSAHTCTIKGKNIIILNCMEYYNSAYYIARSKLYNDNLFGIFCPCSSSDVGLFEAETQVIHNHQEKLYTFLCNRISPLEHSTTKGKSYVYGVHTKTEKRFLAQEYPNETNLNHICGIARLGEEPSYIYGEYVIESSPFGRSDNFCPSPRNIIINNLLTK